MKIIELFAGIGSPRKALTDLKIPHKVLFISEINQRAFIAYKSIFKDKNVNNLGDIKKITVRQIAKFKSKCDLLIFGSPCQDFSVAGKNKGGGQKVILDLVCYERQSELLKLSDQE